MFFHTFGGRAISRTCLNIRKGSDGKSFFFMFLKAFGLIPKCSEFIPNGMGSGRKLVTTGPPQVHTHSSDRYLWLSFFGPPRQPVASTEQTRICRQFCSCSLHFQSALVKEQLQHRTAMARLAISTAIVRARVGQNRDLIGTIPVHFWKKWFVNRWR